MLRIVGIGDNVVDRYLYKNKMYPGGNAVNVPVLARRTGKAQAAYLGCVGNDFAGGHILSALRAEQVDVTHTRVLEGETATADVSLVNSDRVFLGGEVGVSQQIVLTDDDFSFLGGFDVLHTSIYSGLDDLLPRLCTLGPKLSYDYSDKASGGELPQTLEFVDFAVFSGGSVPVEDLKTFARRAAEQGPAQVLITMGSRGSLLYAGGRFYQQGIHPVENLVDTMGAGDSFIARYLTGIYSGESIEEGMRAAAKYAAENCLVCGTFGYEADIR